MKTTAGLGEVDALAIQKKEGRLDEEGVESPPGAIPPVDAKAGVRESESVNAGDFRNAADHVPFAQSLRGSLS